MAVGDFKDGPEKIREGLVGSENTKIALVLIQPGHVPQELTQDHGILSFNGTRRRDGHGMGVEIGHAQVLQEESAVGVRIRPHATITLRSQFGQFREKTSSGIEQLFCVVAFHPAFELPDMIGVFGIDEDRHLMGPEGALDWQTVNDLGPGPALG